MGSETKDRLASAPLGTKAPAIGGGHWVKVAAGWQWHNGNTFPAPGGDWDGTLAYPEPPNAEALSRAVERWQHYLAAYGTDNAADEDLRILLAALAASRAEVERLREAGEFVRALENREFDVRYLGADSDGNLITPWRVQGVAFKGFAHAETPLAALRAARTAQGGE